jgi:hypothetical protein
MQPVSGCIMNFNRLISAIVVVFLMLSISSCSNDKKEATLVELHTTAAQDVVSLEFGADTQSVVSINSDTPFSVQGKRTNGSSIRLTSQVEWSLSSGAQSSISKQGILKAAATAESFTLTATLGVLSTSIDIRISDAKFDQVVILNDTPVSLEMCQSQTITPIGKYIDSSGNEEIRPLDNNVIGTINWIILNASDHSTSQSAFIETSGSNTTLYSLAAGDLIIQAQATSAYSGNPTLSAEMNVTVGNALDSIKLCAAGSSDYSACSISSQHVERDQQISFIALGSYTGSAGTSYQNITRTAKWGLSNINISALFSSNMQQLNVTGEVESTTSMLTAACGDIQQPTATIDIAEGIILDSTPVCNANCLASNVNITIDQLSATSLSVSANGTSLNNDETLSLSSAPNEIKLVVNAQYSDNSVRVITDDSTLEYTIIDISGQNKVIEQKANTPGSFTVLAAGTAKIQLNYRGATFIAVLTIP